MKELEIEARTENLDQVISFVDGELAKKECSVNTKIQIDIAVEEIFVNIARYAYNPKTGQATIRVEVRENTVSLTFIDNGIPYDPLSRENPDLSLSADERQIGGLGIFMVKESMDEISYEYRNGSNILSFSKEL